MIGPTLATKYTEVKKKNRECSLYGFLHDYIPDEDNQGVPPQLTEKQKLENLCHQMIQESPRSLVVDYTKRVYIFFGKQ